MLSEIFVCPICEREFTIFSSLSLHLLKKHQISGMARIEFYDKHKIPYSKGALYNAKRGKKTYLSQFSEKELDDLEKTSLINSIVYHDFDPMKFSLPQRRWLREAELIERNGNSGFIWSYKGRKLISEIKGEPIPPESELPKMKLPMVDRRYKNNIPKGKPHIPRVKKKAVPKKPSKKKMDKFQSIDVFFLEDEKPIQEG